MSDCLQPKPVFLVDSSHFEGLSLLWRLCHCTPRQDLRLLSICPVNIEEQNVKNDLKNWWVEDRKKAKLNEENVNPIVPFWPVVFCGFENKDLSIFVSALGGTCFHFSGMSAEHMTALSEVTKFLSVYYPEVTFIKADKRSSGSSNEELLNEENEMEIIEKIFSYHFDLKSRRKLGSMLIAENSFNGITLFKWLMSSSLQGEEFTCLEKIGEYANFEKWLESSSEISIPQCCSERVFKTGRRVEAFSNEEELHLKLFNCDLFNLPAPRSAVGQKCIELDLLLRKEDKQSDSRPAIERPLKAVRLVVPAGLSRKLDLLVRDFEEKRRGYSIFVSTYGLPGLTIVEFDASFSKDVKSGGKDPAEILDDIAEAALNGFLIGARPVARWRTSFHASFRDPDGKVRRAFLKQVKVGGTFVAQREDHGTRIGAGSSYFLPEIVPMLAPEGADSTDPAGNVRQMAFQRFTIPLSDDQKRTLSVECGNYVAPLSADVTSLAVTFHPGDTLLLEWNVAGSNEAAYQKVNEPSHRNGAMVAHPQLRKSHKVLWRHYLRREDVPNDTSKFSMAMLADYNAESRLTAYDYNRGSVGKDKNFIPTKLAFDIAGQTFEQKWTANGPGIPEAGGFPVGPIVHQLLKIAFDDASARAAKGERSETSTQESTQVLAKRLVQLTDNRARLITSFILDGGSPPEWASDDFDHLLGRIADADPYGLGSEYDDAFWRGTFDKAAYRRFWGFGSRYLVNDHCFTFCGFRHYPDLHDAPDADPPAVPRLSFAEEHIHSKHMFGPYAQLYRVYLAIEASLRSVAMQLSALEAGLPQERGLISGQTQARVLDLRHDLDTLSSRLIRTSYSSQIQGRDLSQLMHDQFGVLGEWKELDERVRTFELQWNRIRDIQRQTNLHALYYLGTLLATVTGLIALMPKSKAQPIPSEAIEGFFQRIATTIHTPWTNQWYGYAVAASLVVALWWCAISATSAWGDCRASTPRSAMPWEFFRRFISRWSVRVAVLWIGVAALLGFC